MTLAGQLADLAEPPVAHQRPGKDGVLAGDQPGRTQVLQLARLVWQVVQEDLHGLRQRLPGPGGPGTPSAPRRPAPAPPPPGPCRPPGARPPPTSSRRTAPAEARRPG